MKKIVTLFSAILMLAVFSVNAQLISSDFEIWTNGKPAGWYGAKTNVSVDSIAQDPNFHSGTYSVNLKNMTNSHKRFTSSAVTVKKDTNYSITFWARGSGDIRTGLYTGFNASASGYLYNSTYITVNSTSWTQYTQNIISDIDTNIAEFILSFRNTKTTNNHLQIDDVTISAAVAPSIDTVTIYEIQHTADTSGNSPKLGQTIRTSGIVTGAYASGYWIQDAPGAWNGVYVYDLSNKPSIGDEVFFTAVVLEYNKLTELGTVTGFSVLSTGNQLPAAEVVTASQVNSEAYEGVFVRLNGVKCTNTNAGYGAWVLTDATGSCKVDKLITSYIPTLNTYYNIIAINHFSFAEFKLEPRDSLNDIMIATGINEPTETNFMISPNPVKDVVKVVADQMINMINVYSVQGQLVKSFNCNSKEMNLNLADLNEGVYFVELEFFDKQISSKKIVLNK